MKQKVVASILVVLGFFCLFNVIYTRINNNDVETTEPTKELSLETAVAEEGFDKERKEKAVIELVKRGITYFKKSRLQDVCHAFTHTRDFLDGEVYLFIFDVSGRVYAHGQESGLLWSNMYKRKDELGTLFVQRMIQKAKDGGGWLRYEWRGSIKRSYVQMVKKNGKSYIIGAGYYPHSKEDKVVGLVKAGVALFNRVIKQKISTDVAFSTISYPLSEIFVQGDLYLYALDFKGIIMAQGYRPGLIGTNALEYRDAKGKAVNQEIINQLKTREEGEGVWVEYISKNASKRAYAEQVTDTKGKEYFIACGFYPDADRNHTVDLVRKGYQFMKSSGKSTAVKEFTDKRIKTFRYGDLFLFVYDMKGKVLAHGGNEELVGRNMYDIQDEDGRYFVREIIEKAKAGGGWADFKLRNSFQSVYVEKIDLGIEDFVIGCGLYPVSKNETMMLLVKSAVGFLKMHDEETTFRAFVERDSKFVRGDLWVFVFDQEGVCYSYGDRFNLIWKNLIDWKDDDGRPFIKMFINTAKKGPGKVVFKFNKRPVVAFVEQVKKNDRVYVVGSLFYQ